MRRLQYWSPADEKVMYIYAISDQLFWCWATFYKGNAQALVNIPAIFNPSLCFAAAWIFSKCCFCSKLQKRLSHNWEKETSFLYSSSQTITPFDRDSICFCFVQWWKYLGWIRSLAFLSCPSSSIPTITHWFTHDSSFRAIDAHSVS